MIRVLDLLKSIGTLLHTSVAATEDLKDILDGIKGVRSKIERHCLWILGNGAMLTQSNSVWKKLVVDAKARDCFYEAKDDKNLAQAVASALDVGLNQRDALLKSVPVSRPADSSGGRKTTLSNTDLRLLESRTASLSLKDDPGPSTSRNHAKCKKSSEAKPVGKKKSQSDAAAEMAEQYLDSWDHPKGRKSCHKSVQASVGNLNLNTDKSSSNLTDAYWVQRAEQMK
ncbi:hypothetical protein Acr_21g0001840 [Actinidia rufa]|uniref:Uncharacterized protein n=1 Tax=Actinidia rufa TaxID=165716 RepID=A0A7J0GFN4_9ERIC|nr:hypothetical protein Acr_21g0001840 [Actinidia rufa]